LFLVIEQEEKKLKAAKMNKKSYYLKKEREKRFNLVMH